MRVLALAAALLAGAAWPAAAHAPARLVMVSPAEGARVEGETVRVVVEGRGGRDAAAFRLDLDGRSVDATGRIGGVFSTLSVLPGRRLEIDVPVQPGEHTLTATPNADADSVQVTVVRRFTVAAGHARDGGGDDAEDGDSMVTGVDVVPVTALVVVVALLAGAGLVVARKRR